MNSQNQAKRLYLSRTQKYKAEEREYANCEHQNNCSKIGIFKCSKGHRVCPAHVTRDIHLKLGHRCFCGGEIIQQLKDFKKDKSEEAL